MFNLVSLCGIIVLMLVAWSFSSNRRVVNWPVVFWGLTLQALFALVIFVVPAGTKVFLFVNSMVITILDSAGAGTRFLFGRLALPPGAVNESGAASLGFILAFQALPTIIFFAGLVAALYHVGLMPRLIHLFASAFSRLMRVSGAESLCAASNIFVGVEAATTIRPYLQSMTRSELCTVLTVGMATIASNVMALYVFILQSRFPTIAGHLVSASILSAPAAVVMSKLLVPETELPETLGRKVQPHYERSTSIIESIITGANEGMKLVLGIVALLMAFLGLVALVDGGLGWLGEQVGLGDGLALTSLLTYVFYPFVLVVGVPPADAMEVARLVGERVVVTEVKGYQDLALLLESGGLKEPRSAFIAAYALCGFAHVASLAIFVGGIAALVPARTADLSALGPRALLAANLACLMTAAVAGTFYTSGSILLGGS